MNRIVLITLLLVTSMAYGQNLQTKFEKTGGTETVTYEEGIRYWKNLSNAFPELQMQRAGMTDSGEPLHLILYNTAKDFDISSIKRSGKPILLINNAIHAGEPDGVDASMMLLRNFCQNPNLYPYLKDVVIAVIPFYNIGGVLNRNSTSRVNQNGPEAYGFRGNARNYDLNRDFIKMDTKNAFALVELFQKLDPEVFVDTHVTNGTDHQHTLTLISTQHNKLGGNLGTYLEEEFEPMIFESMEAKDRDPIVYVNVHGDSPDQGWTQFWDAARYSSGYAALYQSLAFISESHMWKPYPRRVATTYDFLETMTQLTAENGPKIIEMRAKDRQLYQQADSLGIQWESDRNNFRMVSLKGYENKMVQNELTGNPLLKYDRDKLQEIEVPFYNQFKTVEKAAVPAYYIIPQQFHEVIDRLQANQVEMEKLMRDSSIVVSSYHIQDYSTYKMAYEGHYPHFGTKLKKEEERIKFRKGDYLVPSQQKAVRYLVEVLEPNSQDSFFNWNYFDTILQQKEGFSDYVFAEKAESILKSLSKQEQETFTKLKAKDEEFANNNYAQLSWIYKRSAHYEEAHLRYPIYKYFE